MNPYYKIAIIIPLILLAGCFGKSEVSTQYYLIEPPAKTGNSNYPENFSDKYCEISRVEIFPAYSSYKIANSNNSNSISYYRDHQWAVLPEEMLTHTLISFFEESSVFKGVSNRFSKIKPDYRIAVIVNKMDVLEDDGKFMARLGLSLKLHDYNTMEVISEKKKISLTELDKKNLDLFAEAISIMFYDELETWAKEFAAIR